MHCPFCSAPETKVIDSRLVSEGYQSDVAVNAPSAKSVLPLLNLRNW